MRRSWSKTLRLTSTKLHFDGRPKHGAATVARSMLAPGGPSRRGLCARMTRCWPSSCICCSPIACWTPRIKSCASCSETGSGTGTAIETTGSVSFRFCTVSLTTNRRRSPTGTTNDAVDGLQGAQRFPVVGVVQPEAHCGARLIVGVKNSVQPVGPGDLGEQPLRVALQVQVPPVRGGLQFLRRLRLARREERFVHRHTGRGWRFHAGWKRFRRLAPQGGFYTQSLAAEPVVQVVRRFSNRLAIQEIGSDDITRPLGLLPFREQAPALLFRR